MKKFYIFFTFLFLVQNFIMAGEFGLVLDQKAKINNLESDDNAAGDTSFEYSMMIIPRYSLLIGDPANPKGNFFVSAGMEIGYDDEFYTVPELLRTELSMHWDSLTMKVGRFGYASPLPIIADGLFDGFQFSHSSSKGRFSIGAWYTGLLYKETANISMTENDREINDTSFEYSNFSGTYFAPKRLLASIDWEHLAVADLLRVNASLSAQIDLADEDQYHSQYLIVKAGFPVNDFFFEAGGSLCAAQYDDGDSFKLSYLGDFGIYWNMPTSFNSRISAAVQFTSGKTGGLWDSFIPFTFAEVGNIFNAGISALTVLGLNYDALFSEKLGTNISAKYFLRNDLATFNTFPFSPEDDGGRFLGAELYARFIWSPVSDLQLNLGAGAFIPALGNSWNDTGAVWQAELRAIFTIY